MRKDALAGVTTAAVVIPQSMAYATIAGLPVQVGLYTALVPLLAYALVGTSRALSVTTTSTIAALTGAAVATVPRPDQAMAAATTLAVLTGLLLVAAGVLKLGFLADFISHPVLAGFKAGTGLLIAVGQLGQGAGHRADGRLVLREAALGDPEPGRDQLADGRARGGHDRRAVRAQARRRDPRRAGRGRRRDRVGAAGLLDVALTGAVPSGLPSPVAPDPGLIGPLLPAAAGIALMSFVESIAAGRAIAHKGEREPDADRELLALGAANLAGGLFRSLPSGGGLSQTAVNDPAETKRAGIVTAVVTALTLLFLTGLFADLPQATLGALVLVSALGLVAVEPLRQIGRIHHNGVWLGLVTLVAVLALGVLEGVLVGVLASMLSLVHHLNHPRIERLDDGAIKITGPLYFANVQRARREVLALAGEDELVLDMSDVNGIDVTAAIVLEELAPQMRGLKPQPRELLRRTQSRANAAANSRSTSK